MANPFDQFDSQQPSTTGGNPFDQFDASPSFSQRVSSDFSKADAASQAAADRYVAGQQGMGQTVFQQALSGGLAKGNAVVGEAIQSGLNGLGSMFPGAAQDVNGVVSSVTNSVPVQYTVNKAQQFNQAHPVIGADVQALGTLVNAAANASGVDAAANALGYGLSSVGKAAYDSGASAQAAKRDSFIKNLVADPLSSKSDKIDAVRRTDVIGPLQKSVIKPTNQEITAAGHVSAIPDVGPQNTYQSNFNIIDEAKNQEAQALRSKLQVSGVQSYDPGLLDIHLNNNLSALKADDPLIVDSSEKVADKTFNKLKAIVTQHPQTPEGLLNARQEFDNWALSKSKNVFDGNTSALKQSVLTARRSLNDYLNQIVPSADVSQSLAKQTSFFNALDNIAPKAAIERPTFYGRKAQNLQNSIPGKTLGAKAAIAGVAGALGYGTLAVHAAPLALVGGAAVLGAKAALAPVTRKAIGNLLENAGKLAGPLSKSDILKLPPGVAIQYLKENNGQKLSN